LILASWLLLLPLGCADTLHVDTGKPHPIIEITPKHGVRLHLDMHHIADELHLDSAAGEVRVHGWRGTLAFGYISGLRASFPPVQGVPVLTVELLEAAPIYMPKGEGLAVALKFSARLVDSAGNVLRKSQGYVEAQRPAPLGDRATLTRATANAVESMYEQLAGDLLVGL
jgi:hypothetical protein